MRSKIYEVYEVSANFVYFVCFACGETQSSVSSFQKEPCRLRAGPPSQSALRLTAPPKGELGERFRKAPTSPFGGGGAAKP